MPLFKANREPERATLHQNNKPSGPDFPTLQEEYNTVSQKFRDGVQSLVTSNLSSNEIATAIGSAGLTVVPVMVQNILAARACRNRS